MKNRKALALNNITGTSFKSGRKLRLIAVLSAVILSLSMVVGCAGSSSTVTETMFKADAADRSANNTETIRYESTTDTGLKEEVRPAEKAQLISVETTAKPVENTTRPVETTLKPTETTAKPAETTTRPVETTLKPTKTTAKPVETTLKPTETTAKPTETTAKPVETTVLSNSPYIPMTSKEKAVADQLLVLLNNYRIENKLAPVAANTGYLKAATVRAREASILFDHKRPGDKDRFFSTVLDDLGLPFVSCGENLAYRSGGVSSDTARLLMNQWIESDVHNENMLKANWKYAGIGVCLSDDGQSVYASQFFAAG